MTQPDLTEAAREFYMRDHAHIAPSDIKVPGLMASFAQAEIDKAITSFVESVEKQIGVNNNDQPNDDWEGSKYWVAGIMREAAKERGVEIK